MGNPWFRRTPEWNGNLLTAGEMGVFLFDLFWFGVGWVANPLSPPTPANAMGVYVHRNAAS